MYVFPCKRHVAEYFLISPSIHCASQIMIFEWTLQKLQKHYRFSDVGVAGLLASAACKGALFNVDINLGSLPEDYAQEIRINAPRIQEESRTLSRQVMDAVREKL